MDLPVIETPVFPRWVWIEEITYSHIPIATLITAFMVLAPIYEYIGYRKHDLRYDRLGKGLIWFAMILFSPGAALGTGIPVFIIGTYPEFWSRWSNLFFWPLVVQFMFFLCEVFFLFFFYYLTWDRWMTRRKRLHIFMGVMAVTFGLLVQAVWDALGGYMLTTNNVPLPGVEEPVGWSAAAFFNPSFPFLFSHRFVGNISYSMLLVGGVYALRYMGTKKADTKKYFGWAADLTFTIGLLSFFAMPIIGWFYARVIQSEAPIAFSAIMGGHVGGVFTVKMGLILTFLLFGGAYLTIRHRSRAVPVAATLGVLSLAWVVFVHPPLDWLGANDGLWRGVCVGVLVAMVVLFWLLRGRTDPEKKRWRWIKFTAGLAAFFTFALGGFVREASKNPDTVYGEIVKPEVTPMEADRYLLYDKCVRCHNQDRPSPKDFARYTPKDWPAKVEQERRRDGAPPMTDEEAQRIVRFLEEHYP